MNPEIRGILVALVLIILLIGCIGQNGSSSDVECSDECFGDELWKMKHEDDQCVKDHLIDERSSRCGYNPCRGIECSDECFGDELWKMNCKDGKCVQLFLIDKCSPQCGCDSCEDIGCPDRCLGDDLWAMKCENGRCVKNRLKQKCSPQCGCDSEYKMPLDAYKSVYPLIPYATILEEKFKGIYSYDHWFLSCSEYRNLPSPPVPWFVYSETETALEDQALELQKSIKALLNAIKDRCDSGITPDVSGIWLEERRNESWHIAVLAESLFNTVLEMFPPEMAHVSIRSRKSFYGYAWPDDGAASLSYSVSNCEEAWKPDFWVALARRENWLLIWAPTPIKHDYLLGGPHVEVIWVPRNITDIQNEEFESLPSI